MTQILLIRINCPDEMCAANIGETLIDRRLAACVNIEGPIESIYIWEDEMVREEVAVTLDVPACTQRDR